MEICFILVEPAVPGNIGAAARAIKTMGFSWLRLVNPCDYLGQEAKMLAHGSNDILEKAEVFSSLGGALSDLDFSVATTSKNRDARINYYRNTELSDLIRAKGNTLERIAIVFGSEESGLSNNEIRMCDMASTIPLKQAYPSLNLSQAVMIYAYSLADLQSGKIQSNRPVTGSKEFRVMMDKSGELFRKLDIDASPALYNRLLERIALLGEDDIHLLLSVLRRLDEI